MLRDPRREDHTIWTASAPDAVFTVRTYATRRDYEPRLSAQIRDQPAAKSQVTAPRPSKSRTGDKSQVDFEREIVHVRYQLKRIKGQGMKRVRLKSKKSRRVLPLPAVAARALRAWRLVQANEQETAGARWDGNAMDLVFTTRFGRPIEPSTINRSLLVLARRAGLRNLHPHALRHSCATFLKAQGVDLIVIRDILGHSQLSVTADIYTHVLAPELREAIERMDGVMSRG